MKSIIKPVLLIILFALYCCHEVKGQNLYFNKTLDHLQGQECVLHIILI